MQFVVTNPKARLLLAAEFRAIASGSAKRFFEHGVCMYIDADGVGEAHVAGRPAPIASTTARVNVREP